MPLIIVEAENTDREIQPCNIVLDGEIQPCNILLDGPDNREEQQNFLEKNANADLDPLETCTLSVADIENLSKKENDQLVGVTNQNENQELVEKSQELETAQGVFIPVDRLEVVLGDDDKVADIFKDAHTSIQELGQPSKFDVLATLNEEEGIDIHGNINNLNEQNNLFP